MHFEALETRRVLQGIPMLHSLPSAAHTIFLDFDGHITRGTSWNVEYDEIHSPAFDADGDASSFNADERQRIISIWERVAEDFVPFDVDVTTDDPSNVLGPAFFETAGLVQRVVVTANLDLQTGKPWQNRDELGVAVRSWEMESDTPVFVFSNHSLAGEIVSHELGHAFGLSHDSVHLPGGPFQEYRGEHGSGETRWSPIMGQGNGLSQWSRGEYPHAMNAELDIGILTASLGRRGDDYVGIHNLGSTSSIEVEGHIEHSADVDTFSFRVDSPQTRVTLDIQPWHNGPNLDVGVSLLGESGNRILGLHDTNVNPTDRLASHIDIWLEPGTYYLNVEGVGKAATHDDPGYSDYGSLGYYRVRGELAFFDPRSDLDGDGDVDFADFLILSHNFGDCVECKNEDDFNALVRSYGYGT